jgi:predicted 2-oxoglutarate/Fe(II)-dependent dioxygenase YbiX
LHDFLPGSEHRQLLEWVLSNSRAFQPATITSGTSGAQESVKPSQRIALTTRVPDELQTPLTEQLIDALDQVVELTCYKGPRPLSIELELAAHGDGAFYRPHLDIPLGHERIPLGALDGEDRALSAVYYFHRTPKRFSGGELRLHRFGSGWDRKDADASTYLDLQPVNGSLVVFPSWAMHEVRPVECQSGRFEDYRFALNCWFCRPAA